MFSIIIPLHNKADYIQKAIGSVLNQTFQEFELIIVNDGSYDRSLENAEIYTDSRIQILNQLNLGVSRARNNGVKIAKNGFITFLDADDWWEPTFLEKMKTLIEKFPNAGIYGSSYFIIKHGQKKKAHLSIDPNFVEGLLNYFEVYSKTLCMPFCVGSVVIPKKIFEFENGFKTELKMGEDFDLWIRLALKYPVVFLNIPLTNYNQDSEKKSRASQNLHNIQNHVLWNLDYLKAEELTNSHMKQLFDNLRAYSLWPYYLRKDTRLDAIKELNKVDWEKQHIFNILKYKLPIILMKILHSFMLRGSILKKRLRFR